MPLLARGTLLSEIAATDTHLCWVDKLDDGDSTLHLFRLTL